MEGENKELKQSLPLHNFTQQPFSAPLECSEHPDKKPFRLCSFWENQVYSIDAIRPQLGRKRLSWAQAQNNPLLQGLYEPSLILGGYNSCWKLELETNQIKAMSLGSVPAALAVHTSALLHRYKTWTEDHHFLALRMTADETQYISIKNWVLDTCWCIVN